jgi:hypothetical protein
MEGINQAHKVRCKNVDSSKKVKFYSNSMVWWRSLRYSKVRCKYVDSSKNVKFYSNLMVWWRSLRHSNQRERSKEGTGVAHPEAQIATWN